MEYLYGAEGQDLCLAAGFQHDEFMLSCSSFLDLPLNIQEEWMDSFCLAVWNSQKKAPACAEAFVLLG